MTSLTLAGSNLRDKSHSLNANHTLQYFGRKHALSTLAAALGRPREQRRWEAQPLQHATQCRSMEQVYLWRLCGSCGIRIHDSAKQQRCACKLACSAKSTCS